MYLGAFIVEEILAKIAELLRILSFFFFEIKGLTICD
jgi:hypothetical protein